MVKHTNARKAREGGGRGGGILEMYGTVKNLLDYECVNLDKGGLGFEARVVDSISRILLSCCCIYRYMYIMFNKSIELCLLHFLIQTSFAWTIQHLFVSI